MRIRFIVLALFAISVAARASSTLRVGSHVLAAGDSSERVTELLGKPSAKTHGHGSRGSRKHAGRGSRSKRGSRHGGLRGSDGEQTGEQWRYRRGGHAIVVTLVDGRVSRIEDNRL